MASFFERYKAVKNTVTTGTKWDLKLHLIDDAFIGIILTPAIEEIIKGEFLNDVKIIPCSTKVERDCSNIRISFDVSIEDERRRKNIVTINENGVLKSKTRICLGDKNFVKLLIDGIDISLIRFRNYKGTGIASF